MRRFILALTLACALPAFAADPADEISTQRHLMSAIESLEFTNLELPKAFQQIAEKGKISLQIDPTCYDLLPYGDTTKVSATFRQSKLKEAIDEILKPLALEQTVSGDKVLITPTAPLRRIGRRATWDELRILAAARQETLPGLSGNNLQQNLRTVLSMDTLQLHIANPTGPIHDAAIEQVKRQLPAEVWKALDIYAEATNQIWFVSDNAIEIMSKKQWLERQLERRIEIKKTNKPLVECVSELAHLSGIHFTPEPGLYSMFPAVTLNSTGGTVHEILDTLRGVIGLDYEVKDDAILLKRAKADSQPAGGGARNDPILGQITIKLDDGGEAVLFIRESTVSPELAELIRKKMAAATDKLKDALTTPETAPATRKAMPAQKDPGELFEEKKTP